MKRFGQRDKVIESLLETYMTLKGSFKAKTFAQICEFNQQNYRKTRDRSQNMIDLIEDVYAEYEKLGESQFLSKYSQPTSE